MMSANMRKKDCREMTPLRGGAYPSLLRAAHYMASSKGVADHDQARRFEGDSMAFSPALRATGLPSASRRTTFLVHR